MDEGGEGKPVALDDQLAALNASIAALMDMQQNRLALDLEHLRWLHGSIEADFRFIRRRKWLMRALVFWNITAGCWCLASWPRPVAFLAALSAWST